MTATSHETIVETFDWHGILIDVSYEPAGFGGHPTAHLTVETRDPPRTPLPITETGHRSHFMDHEIVERAGGPAAYVLAWLERTTTRRWRTEAGSPRQYCLF